MEQMIAVGSPEWHAERRKGLGGSDAAAVFGLSRYKSPLDLYLEKIGEADPVDETWDMARGKALEPLLRQHYADTTGRTVRVPKDAIKSSAHRFMFYNPDGLTDDNRLVEFKTAAYDQDWGMEGSDDIPMSYLLQVQHGMVVTGLKVADVTVSIGGCKPKYFVVEEDKELQETLIKGEAMFWARVQGAVPPPPSTREDVARLFPVSLETEVAADEEVLALLRGLARVKHQLKELEQQQEGLETAIKVFVGSNERLVDPDTGDFLATWKSGVGAKRINTTKLKQLYPDIAEAVTELGDPVRRFLIKQPKKG
jgi:putative phage-type endonuclease